MLTHYTKCLCIYFFPVNKKGRYFLKALDLINIDFIKMSQIKFNEQKTEVPSNHNPLF